MNESTDLNNHSITRYAGDVQAICATLNQYFNISYFNHIRYFADGKRICLTNNSEWVQHFCRKKYYLLKPLEDNKNNHDAGHILWDNLKDSTIYQTALSEFNINHGLTFVEKGENYTDFYHFGNPAQLIASNDYYLGLIDVLKKFILYYKEKAHKLILTSNILHFPEFELPLTAIPISNPFEEIKKNFLADLNIQRYYLGGKFGDNYLTARELDCAKWLAMGKSAEEIALILDVTPRTAITHINNIKEKLNCVKTSQLVFKLAQSQLAELLFT